MLSEHDMTNGIKSTNMPLNRSQATIVYFLFHLSTQIPAIGPTIKTGSMVKDKSLASSMVEPGIRAYIRPISAI